MKEEKNLINYLLNLEIVLANQNLLLLLIAINNFPELQDNKTLFYLKVNLEIKISFYFQTQIKILLIYQNLK